MPWTKIVFFYARLQLFGVRLIGFRVVLGQIALTFGALETCLKVDDFPGYPETIPDPGNLPG